MIKKTTIATVALLFVAVSAGAATVPQETAQAAAEGFLSKSPVAKRVLAGRTVSSLQERGNLWIVGLAPSGYIELAASTKCAPVISFSAEDFVEPDEDSPLAAQLMAESEHVASMEADESLEDNAQWAAFTAPVKRRLLLAAAPSAAESDIFVDSFIGASWAQGSPMNDFTPRRSPCGCVATAAGQEFRYWRWPYRFEAVDTFTHALIDDHGNSVPYDIRLDGRVAVDWDNVSANGGASTPNASDKTAAYNTAYLTAWMQDFGAILFKPHAGSGLRKVNACADMAFYEQGRVMSRGSDGYDALWTAVTNDLARGIPIQINTPLHQMVIDGYAVDSSGDWINTNYGWGNPTRWENFDTVTTEGGGAGVFAHFQVGFYPQKIVQFEPVPKVSTATVPLTWHIAPCYTNKINGFTLEINKFTEAATLADDFSASTGTASGEKFKVEDGYLGGYPAIQDSTYTYPDIYLATDSATLTFNAKSRYMSGHTATVEVKANSGAWKSVYTIALNEGRNNNFDSAVPCSVDLSAYAGKTIQLRFHLSCGWAGYTAGGTADFRIDDVSLTGVKGVAATSYATVAKDDSLPSAYSYTAENLDAGSSYAFTVTPFMSDQSEARPNTVTTTIGTPAAAPEITGVSSIAGGIELVQEGFFVECAYGQTNDITVACSESVTSLEAFPSHLSILPDEKVSVEKSGNVFTISIDATDMMATKKFWSGDMLMLTLVSKNADGTETWKNLMLRFNSMRQVLGGEYEIVDASVDSAVWFCGDTTLDAKGQSVTFAANTFMGAGCTVTLIDTVGGGSFSFANLDGFTGTLAFAGSSDLSVTLPADMSGFSGTISITSGQYILSCDLPATATLDLGESGTAVGLDNASIAGAITGFGEVNVTDGTCAVTGSIGPSAVVVFTGGTLNIAQGLEPRIQQQDGTLNIELTAYQTAYGYEARIPNYISGTIKLIDSDGNEVVSSITGDAAYIDWSATPPTFVPATTTISYTGNANVWTGVDPYMGENYTAKWSSGLPQSGDYVIFDDASGDTYGALMMLNISSPMTLGYVRVTGGNFFQIDKFSGVTPSVLSVDVFENEISTKIATDFFQPATVIPKAKLCIANGITLSCEIDYTLATNLRDSYDTKNAIAYADYWTGTVVITNYMAAGLNPGEYGNSKSTVRLSGVEGWLANNKEYYPTVELVDYGTKPALKWNNGSASSTVTFDALSGDGTFQTTSPNAGGKESVIIKDVSKFTGSFSLGAKKIAIADSMMTGIADVNNGRLIVCKAATIAAGANWWANGGTYLGSGCDLTVKGTLDATSNGLNTYADGATLTLDDGGVIKVAATLAGDYSPTVNLKAGTFQWTANTTESNTVSFCAADGGYTTLDAGGHAVKLTASFFSGSSDIYLTSSSSGGSFVIEGISTDYTGTIYTEESLKVKFPDDLSTQGGTINIAGSTLTVSSAKLGKVRLDGGGTLSVTLTDEQAMTGFDASSLVTFAGGTVEFVDQYGTVISTSSESAVYTRPESYTLAPTPTAVWVSGQFADEASKHGGYAFDATTLMYAGTINDAGNIAIDKTAYNTDPYFGAMIDIASVTNCTKVSILVKFKMASNTSPTNNAVLVGVYDRANDADSLPFGAVCKTAGSSAVEGYWIQNSTVKTGYAFSSPAPVIPSGGEGYMLFSAYSPPQGTNSGNKFYIGESLDAMSGGEATSLRFSNKEISKLSIGGPITYKDYTDGTAPWFGLEIEAVALFVDEWFTADNVKWYEFPEASFAGRTVYYKSGYWGTGGDTSLVVTLADGTVTTLREGDTIVIDDKSSGGIYFGPLPEYANKIRVSRDVVFSSGVDNAAILDGATIEIDDGKTVTFKAQYHNIALGKAAITGEGSIAFDANGFSISLDPEATVNDVAVRPELDLSIATPYDATKEKVFIKAIPGLWYSVIYGDALVGGGIGGATGETEPVLATGATLTLDAPKEGATRFYRIKVVPVPAASGNR